MGTFATYSIDHSTRAGFPWITITTQHDSERNAPGDAMARSHWADPVHPKATSTHPDPPSQLLLNTQQPLLWSTEKSCKRADTPGSLRARGDMAAPLALHNGTRDAGVRSAARITTHQRLGLQLHHLAGLL